MSVAQDVVVATRGSDRASRLYSSMRRRPALIAGSSMLAIVVAASFAVPALWPYSDDALVANPLQSPSFAHPFGTDELGRDVFVRVMAGGQLDLLIAVLAVSVAAAIGALVGTMAGLSPGWVDTVLMRLTDALIAFPFIVLVVAIATVFGTTQSWGPLPAGFPAVVFAVVVIDWAVYARISRAQTLSLRNRDFILAARTLGYSKFRVLVRHVWPNLVGAVGGYMVTDAVIVILVTAGLPFLGAGIQPPVPEWGEIMQEGSSVLGNAWWVTVCPGAVLAFTAIGLSLVADGLINQAVTGQ
jgi:peptide/nickel transport system permease protein